ncbi:alpha/beta fold hydrolase [Agrococcus sp. Marseille-P2731]|uniref:alpha/beta fold hydrolase n=1 Tax=Agrococcus sp. Marseille-P2731 TaxID=1841862 RepID=UPI0009F9A79D|nr:alpha/beta hydrolase [Agrococcus sp. Marseille-P2731]
MPDARDAADGATADVPLIDPPERSMVLADGRRTTWQEFGVADGRPVLYLHGGGSTSIEGGIFHREAVHHGVRLIATNRPGARGSTLAPGRPAIAYADDVAQVLDHLGVERMSCFGESNGGLMTMVVASGLPDHVASAAPINPTLPWFDPAARRVSSRSTALAYRLLRHAPGLLAAMDARASRGGGADERSSRFADPDLVGPPPGTEPDVAALHRRMLAERAGKEALLAELRLAGRPWGFDHYGISAPLDLFCGEQDVQAPFARVLAERNPDARFHSFAYGHHGFSHPDARRRIVETLLARADA